MQTKATIRKNKDGTYCLDNLTREEAAIFLKALADRA